MDMQELADAKLKFTMVRESGVTYSMGERLGVGVPKSIGLEGGRVMRGWCGGCGCGLVGALLVWGLGGWER